jgi:hypothetical protein
MSNRTQRRAEQRRNAKLARKAGQPSGAWSTPTENSPSLHAVRCPASSLGTAAQSAVENDNITETAVSPTVSQASEAQIAANRENATHSTGPVSPAGKAAVSQNRRTHGLNCSQETFTVLPCENQADYDRLLQTLLDEQKPQNTVEEILVSGLAQHRWLLNRANRLQETCLDPQTGQVTDQKLFALYLRYATTHERAFHKCLNDLAKLRKDERTAQIGFESNKRAADRHQLFLNLRDMEEEYRRVKLRTADLDELIAEKALMKAERALTAA